MVRDPRALLWDARTSGDAIDRFLSAKDFDDYLADEMLRSAVSSAFAASAMFAHRYGAFPARFLLASA